MIVTTYNSVSENLNATEPSSGGEAEGNCVAARLCGEQPDARKQFQTYVNSIQPLHSASLLGIGEACAKRDFVRRHLPAFGES